jgi:uncharacterized protein (DUF1697 family)
VPPRAALAAAHADELLVSLGLQQVETFIASGNVVFTTEREDRADALERWLSEELERAFGFAVAVFLRTSGENVDIANRRLTSAVSFPPVGDTLYVAFLHEPPSADATRALQSFESDVDRFFVHEREIYWHCRKTISTSDFSGARLEKLLGAPATMRNITTVRKLAAKYPL